MTKNLERKKKEQIQGRTNRIRPIFNPTIQLVVVNLYTEFEVYILKGCGDIFDEKVLRNYGRTDGRTDGRTGGTTDRCKPVYPPLFQSWGITRYFGPYIVEKKASDLNYTITTPDRRKQKQLCHINILNEYVDRDNSNVTPINVINSVSQNNVK